MTKAKKEPQRFTVVSDNDGHEYCIPVDQEKHFYRWLDDENLSIYEDPCRYDEYRFDCRLTFTDPRFVH